MTSGLSCHGCWYPDDVTNHDINSYGHHLVVRNILISAQELITESLITFCFRRDFFKLVIWIDVMCFNWDGIFMRWVYARWYNNTRVIALAFLRHYPIATCKLLGIITLCTISTTSAMTPISCAPCKIFLRTNAASSSSLSDWFANHRFRIHEIKSKFKHKWILRLILFNCNYAIQL